MRKPTRKTTLEGSEIVRGLTGLRDALRDGVPIDKRFTARTVGPILEPREFTAADIKRLRASFNASQAVFAMLVGIKPSTLRSWEQGRTGPPPWGRRLLEMMRDHPEPFLALLKKGAA